MLLTNQTFEKYGYDPEKLTKGSQKLVCIQCDYCGLKFEKMNQNFLRGRKFIAKDTCRACFGQKNKEAEKVKHPEGHFSRSKEYREKCIKNLQEKHGKHITNVFQLQSTKDKIIETSKEKYGVSHHLKNPEIMKKQRETNMKNFGFAHALQNPVFNQKMHETMKLRYGAEHAVNIQKFKNEMVNTCQQKYDRKSTGNLNISKESMDLLNNKEWLEDQHINKKKSLQEIAKEIGISDITSTVSKYFKFHGIPAKKHCVSAQEREIVEYIKSLGVTNIITSDRTILAPKELDIYLPDHGLAIEYCGLYWHSNEYIENALYHFNKFKDCEIKGIKLITLFEDEWNDNKSVVKKEISKILSKPNDIPNHEYIIKINDNPTESKFLEEHHVFGGNSDSTVSVGAYFRDMLVCLMTFKPLRKNKWKIGRMAGICKFEGLEFLLFNAFVKRYNPSFVYARNDLRWDESGKYLSMNFKYLSTKHPNYYFTKEFARFDKMNEQWKDLDRIYDCGSRLFVWSTP